MHASCSGSASTLLLPLLLVLAPNVLCRKAELV
jgi:hypothetical protein